ncbi:DUF5366 family protein, partial [Cobetia sp. SIMBA_158]|uniref:DUF5366 family protein n=1 Tax=Cobetia sp. SIMBA_158 TaxID=3081617 RepID=UPI00397E99A3
FGIQSFTVLITIFLLTVFIYFIYNMYKMSQFLTMSGTVGLLVYEILFWSILMTLIMYVVLKLFNGILASLPFAN